MITITHWVKRRRRRNDDQNPWGALLGFINIENPKVNIPDIGKIENNIGQDLRKAVKVIENRGKMNN
jgi:hypothetical protein